MQTVLIIGAGAGISGGVARRFGREGYKIGLVARSAAALELQCNELAAAGMGACFETADAGDPPRLQYAIERLTEQLGPIDVLIYNASVMRPASPLELSTEQLSHEFSVNLLGAFQAAQQVAPSMIRRGLGAILFTGGGLALEPYPEWTSLALGKAALRSLSLSLYKELSPKGVHVSVLAVCGIVEQRGPFDPDIIADEYYRVATAPNGIEDREVIIQPEGTDVFYNDPDRRHAGTTLPPSHVRETVKL